MKQEVLFREEKNGGYKFNRESGIAEFYEGENFKKKVEQTRVADTKFDFVPRPKQASDIALTAPLAVWHETTQACNLNCTPCGRRQTGEEELAVEQIDKIYQDLATSGVFELRVTGGEACMRPDIDQIVLAAKKHGFFVSLTSNGVYNHIIREKIANLPIGLFILSLDGTKDINDSVRGHGSYDSTIATIESLTVAGKNVRVNTVLMQQTQGCIEELVDVLANKGVSALTLIPLRPVGAAVANFDALKLDPEQYRNVVERVGKLRQQYRGFSIGTNYDILSTTSQGENVPAYWSKMCMAAIESACVSPQGDLRACIVAPIGIAGNLLKKRMYELWHNDKLWGIFRDMDRRVLEQCRDCNEYKTKCPGSCIAMTEYLRTTGKPLNEMYCFRDQIVK